MSVKVWKLTDKGRKFASSPRPGSGPRWDAIHYLRTTGNATDDMLRDRGIGGIDIMVLRRGRKPLIEEVCGEGERG